MDRSEHIAKDLVSSTLCVVQLTAGAPVVTVVREAAELKVELVGPLEAAHIRVEHDVRDRSGGRSFESEASAVSAWKQACKRVIASVASLSAPIDGIDEEVSRGKVGEFEDRRRVCCGSHSA